jgi:hypothetical protein
MGCLIEGNSIGLWLSPSGQAWVEKCIFCRNAYGCLWSGEGARNETAPQRNETAPAPAAALDPDSTPQETSHRQQHPPTRGVKSRGGSRSRGDRGHVTLNLVQNTIHGRLWVSPCPLSSPPHLLPPPCSDLQSLAHDLALLLPGLCRPSQSVSADRCRSDFGSSLVTICLSPSPLRGCWGARVVWNTQAHGGEMHPGRLRKNVLRKNVYIDDRGFSRRE